MKIGLRGAIDESTENIYSFLQNELSHNSKLKNYLYSVSIKDIEMETIDNFNIIKFEVPIQEVVPFICYLSELLRDSYRQENSKLWYTEDFDLIIDSYIKLQYPNDKNILSYDLILVFA